MNKKFMFFTILLLVAIEAIVLVGIYELHIASKENIQIFASDKSSHEEVEVFNNLPAEAEKLYLAFAGENLINKFGSFEEALQIAEGYEKASIHFLDEIVWDNYSIFYVTQNGNIIGRFEVFSEALELAKNYESSMISFKETGKEIWAYNEEIKESINMEVKPIKQMPELARGCEVTSLAMLLSHAELEVSKMTLAEEIEKNPIEIHYKGKKKYSGDLNDGFIGNIYTFKEDGLGVYHKPIFRLAKNYLGESVLDITGFEFQDVYQFLSKGYPVWIITNSAYAKLPESNFETWYLPDETPMKVTYKEHSVLITGYDNNYIYFNDPFTGHAKTNKKNFIDAWEQMGKQAITYTNPF